MLILSDQLCRSRWRANWHVSNKWTTVCLTYIRYMFIVRCYLKWIVSEIICLSTFEYACKILSPQLERNYLHRLNYLNWFFMFQITNYEKMRVNCKIYLCNISLFFLFFSMSFQLSIFRYWMYIFFINVCNVFAMISLLEIFPLSNSWFSFLLFRCSV